MASIPLPPNWSNWIEDYGANADRYVANSQQDLIDFVNRAVKSGRRIRAVGAGHSMSKCARPQDSFIVLGEGLSGAFPEVKWLKRNPPGLAAGERLIRVKAGTRLKTLNRIILPAQNPPAALINMGAFDGQTISGAISTGTHGSGATLGGLADAVVSLDMVCVTKSSDGTPHVQLHRFEPANGVTDRAAFDADKLQHGMVLEQDDDIFNSVVVSYGCMGIAFAYTLKVRDAYWLREDTTLMDWPVLRAALADPITPFVPGAGKSIPKFITEDRHFQILINVAETQGKRAKEDIACNVIRRNIAKADDKPAVWLHDGWPPERRNPFLRNLLKELLSGVSAPRAQQDNDRFGQTLRNRYFEVEAKEQAFTSNRTATANYICLKRERDLSPPDKEPDPPDAAISLEIAVPPAGVARAVDAILEEIRAQEWFFAVPLGVRFAPPSFHHLATNYGRGAAYVEVPFLQIRASKGGKPLSPQETTDQIAKPALERIERRLINDAQLQGRPHLGKFNSITYADLKKLYAEFSKWEGQFRRFNQFGTFENGFTDQLGLTGLR